LAKAESVANTILDQLLGAGTYGATMYLALFTTAPTESGGGTEVSGGAYARCSYSDNSTTWPAAVGGTKANGIALAFPTPTAPWGDVEAWAIFDAASAGNMVLFGELDAAVSIDTDDVVQFAAGDLSFDEV
jgi:hypothetical protein